MDDEKVCEQKLEVANANPDFPLYLTPECPAPPTRYVGMVLRATAESDYKKKDWFSAEWWVCDFHAKTFFADFDNPTIRKA